MKIFLSLSFSRARGRNGPIYLPKLGYLLLPIDATRLSRMRTFRESNDDSDPMLCNNNSMRTMPRGFSGETRKNGRKGGRKRDDDTVGKKTNSASATRAFERHDIHRVLARSSFSCANPLSIFQ